MSLRIDTTDLIAGSLVIGNTGLGVLGASIPTTGGFGASVFANDMDPGDEAKEFRALLVSTPTLPPGASFFMHEDGSVELSNITDGTYSFTYRLFVDGVDLGLSTATIVVGSQQVTLNIAGCVQTNTASTASVSVQGVQSVVLSIAGCSQANTSSTVTVSLPQQVVVLSIAQSTQNQTCSTVTVVVSPPSQNPPDEVDVHIRVRTWPKIRKDIVRTRGDTYADEFVFTNVETLEPANMTGYSFTLVVDSRSNPSDTSTQVFQILGTTDSNVLQMTPSTEQANEVGYFHYDLQAFDPQGLRRTVAYGRYVIQ